MKKIFSGLLALVMLLAVFAFADLQVQANSPPSAEKSALIVVEQSESAKNFNYEIPVANLPLFMQTNRQIHPNKTLKYGRAFNGIKTNFVKLE